VAYAACGDVGGDSIDRFDASPDDASRGTDAIDVAASELGEGSAAEGCLFDSSCLPGETCSGGVCNSPDCTADFDCAYAMSCRDGRCRTASRSPCQSEDECGAGRTCVRGECRSRSAQSRAIEFELLALSGITDRTASALTPEDRGIGAALADVNGDLLLDIVFGWDAGSANLPYIFENNSTSGVPLFVPLPARPAAAEAFVTTIAGVDINGDGDDELVEAGAQHLHLVDPGPSPTDLDLLALIDAGLPDQTCHAGPVIAADLDYSGTIDLLVGCQGTFLADYSPMGRPRIPIQLWLGDGNGDFAWEDGDGFEVVRGGGDVLALGALDVNRDGLLDLVAAADTLSNPEARNTSQWPGGYFVACSPLESCRYRYHRFADDAAAWGSLMGVAGLTTARDTLVYLTDWGFNRAVSIEGSGAVDRAATLGIDLPERYSGDFQSSWAPLVDDYDRNGLDDLYVSRSPPSLPAHHTYSDVVLAQYGDEQFDVRHRPRPLPSRPEALGHPWPFIRGGTRADLDHDGRLEVVLGTMLRRLIVMREVVAPAVDEPRCTVVPRPRVVPGGGVGYRVADNWSERFRVRDVQGQHRFGQSSHLTLSFGRGVIEFPSGARVPFDCRGTPGPILVEEPDWIDVSGSSDAVVVTLDAMWLTAQPVVTLAVEGPDFATFEAVASHDGDGRWSAEVPAGTRRVMIRLDGRWVARWWELHGEP
jgi:hypothetical protein